MTSDLTDLDPIAPLVGQKFWILGDAVWQQCLVRMSQWVPQLLFLNLGFILILDLFTTKYCGLVDKLLYPAFRLTSPKQCLFSQ